MRILNTQFIQGVVDETAILYDGIPQIAFIGRSNVGKSSTLNVLVGQKKLVKVGQTPGKTQEINFFMSKIDSGDDSTKELYLVDLPGYGYAKLSKERRKVLKERIFWYLEHPEVDLAVVCLIIDAKVGLTDLDREMIDVLKRNNRDYLLAVNKIDKLNQKTRHNLASELKKELGDESKYVLYSASKSKHTDVLLDVLLKVVFDS